MAIRPKTRRRLVLVLAGFMGLVLLGTGFYFFRTHQLNQRAVASLAQGRRDLAAGDYFAAMHAIGSYCQRYPNDAGAWCDYALSRQNVPEKDGAHISSAINLYRRVLTLDSANDQARKALLDLYIQAQYATEARALADDILKSGPEPHALRAKVLAHLRLRQFDQALAAAEQLNKIAPTDIEGQILTFQVLLANGKKPADLVDRAQKLQQAHPADPHFMLLLGMAYAAANDRPQATAWTQKAAAGGITDAPSALLLSSQLSALGLFEASVAALDHADAKVPSPKLRQASASLLWQMGRSEELLSRLAKLDPADPKADADLLGYRALVLMQAAHAEQANPILNGLAARPHDPKAAAWVSVIKAIFAKPAPDQKERVQICGDAVRADPGNPCFEFYAGEAYAGIGEQDMALEHWKQAASLAPAWPLPLVRLSNAYLARRDVKHAVEMAVAARARAPRDVAALSSFAAAGYAAMGAAPELSADKLLAVIDQVQSLSPGEDQTLALKIVILARSNRKDAAIAAIRSMVDGKTPVSESALIQIAAISRQAKLGLEDACYQRCEKLYGLTPNLAFAQAQALRAEGHPDQGLQLLDRARAKGTRAKESSARDWQLAWARYLEDIADARAKEAWTILANQHPKDIEIQQAALGAASVQSERDFVAATIDRVHALTGDRGAMWRVARARWVLSGKPTDQELSEITSSLSEVVRSAPDDLLPRVLLASALEHLGNNSGAINQLTAAAVLKPDSAPIAIDLARLFQSQHQFDRARDQLDHIAAIASLTAEQRAQAARLCAQQGDDARARKFLETAAEKTPGTDDDLLLAALYRRQGEVEKAQAIYERLLKNPTEPAVRAAADFCAALGRQPQAEQALALLDQLKLEPGVKDADWAAYYERLSKADQAVAKYEAAVAAAPNNPRIWRGLLGARILFGQADRISADLHNAVAANPSDPSLHRLAENQELLPVLVPDASLRPLLLALMSPADADAASQALRIVAEARAHLDPLRVLAPKLRPLADRYQQCLPLQVLTAQIYFEAAALNGAGQPFSDDAANLALRAMQAFPGSREPAQAAAGILGGLGRWAEALDAANRWRDLAGLDKLLPDVAIAQAQIGLGKPALALKQLDPYLHKGADAPDSDLPALANAARAHLMLHQVDAAAALLRPCLKRSPSFRAAWMQLMTGYPDTKAAAAWLDEVRPLIPPTSFSERVLLAQCWTFLVKTSGDPAIAQSVKLQVADLTAQMPDVPKSSTQDLLALAMLQEAVGDETSAERSYRHLIHIQPNPSISANNLAMILIRHHSHLDEAVALSTKATQLNPGVGAYLDTLALAQAAVKKYDPAAQTARSALKTEPDNIGFRLTLIRILADKGDVGQAKAEFQALRQLPMDASKTPPQLREQIDHMRQELNL